MKIQVTGPRGLYIDGIMVDIVMVEYWVNTCHNACTVHGRRSALCTLLNSLELIHMGNMTIEESPLVTALEDLKSLGCPYTCLS